MQRSKLCPGSACKAGRLPALPQHFASRLPFSISKDKVLNTDLEEILKLIREVTLQKAEFISQADHRHRWQNKEESLEILPSHSDCHCREISAAIAYLHIFLQLLKFTLQAADGS